MIRISIMRLKHIRRGGRGVRLHPSINDKNLNYEIETIGKHDYRFRRDDPIGTINDKNLNYEIETTPQVVRRALRYRPINDKNLNYEIETDLYTVASIRPLALYQ